MKRTIGLRKIIEATLLIAIVAGTVATANGQQQPVVGHASSASVQVMPRNTTLPPGSIAPTPGALKTPVGSITGYVLWDISAAHYKPAAPCQGLTLSVSTIASPHSNGGQTLATTTNFTAQGPARDYSTAGMPQYMLCVYALQKIPTGVYLRVTLSVQPSTFFPAVSAQSPPAFEIFGGNCNSGPQGTLSYILTGGELVCGNNAFNINFKLQSAGTRLQSGPSTTPLIRGTASGSGLLNGTATDVIATPDTFTHATMIPLAPSASTSTMSSGGSSGMLVPAVRPGASAGLKSSASSGGTAGMLVLAISPGTGAGVPSSGTTATFTGGLAPAATGSFSGGVRPALLPAFNGGVRVITGRRIRIAAAQNSSLIGLLRKQKQQVGPVSYGHTLASGSLPPIYAKQPNVKVQRVSQYVSSNLLTPQQNAWCQQWEAQGGAPTIFSIAGKAHGQGVVYSPDPQANPYTLVGCGFGSTSGNATLGMGLDTGSGFAKALYTLTLTVKSWNDHQIVVSLDPNTTHVPDWNGPNEAAYVSIQSSVGRNSAGPGQFYAARQTVLLSNLSQNEASLYQQGTPYFMSPVANYYGLNGTAGVMRQALPANAVAAQDNFNLQLAPKFVVDSTQTDLLVATTSSNVTSKPATVSGNTITVTYPVLSAGSGNSANYYSIYGLKVWVTGPAGIPPVVSAP